MRFLTIILALCAVAAPAVADDHVVFLRTKSTATQTWNDPTDPNGVTSASLSKRTETEYVVRNLTTGQESVIRILLVPRAGSTVANRRVFKINATNPLFYASVVFGPIPQVGARVSEDPVAIATTSSNRPPLLQRASGSTPAVPRNYLFELDRLSESVAGSPNPILSQTQYTFGLQVPTRLRLSLQTLDFPTKLSGVVTRWEKQTHGIDPYRTLRPAKEIQLTNGTINSVTDFVRSDETRLQPAFDNPEALALASNAYAVRVVTNYLERVGFVNYDNP